VTVSFLLLASLLAGNLQAQPRSIQDIQRAVIAQEGGAEAVKNPGPYGWKGVKVLSDNGFDVALWQFRAAAKIKNEYGLRAFSILAENYSKFEEGVLEYCAAIDTSYALEVFSAAAKSYKTLYVWQVRWISEIHTARAVAAYWRVTAGRYTEKDLAQAVLVDGLKSESAGHRERRFTRREVLAFQALLRGALAGLSRSCRTRLSGGEVVIRQWNELGASDDVIVRYAGPARAPSDACAEQAPGKLIVNMVLSERGFGDSSGSPHEADWLPACGQVRPDRDGAQDPGLRRFKGYFNPWTSPRGCLP
jgi:hypothetical protein